MPEFDGRGRGHDRGYASQSSSGHAHHVAERTPEEKANDAAVAATREVDAVQAALQSIENARAENDPAAWKRAADRLPSAVALAERDLERARALVAASPEAQQRLAEATKAFDDLKRRAANIGEAPRGWTEVSRESEILAVLTAPIEGSAQAGFARKEEALRAELAQLSVVESRALTKRLNTAHDGDAIAAAFKRLRTDRRQRIIDFLDGARRREALQAAHNKSTQLSAPPSTTSATGATTGDARVSSDTPLQWQPDSIIVEKPTVHPPENDAQPELASTSPMDVFRLDPQQQTAPPSRDISPQAEVPGEATRLYLQTNSDAIWRTIRSHLLETSWPAASDQFSWKDEVTFTRSVVDGMHDAVMAGAKSGDINTSQLGALLYPLDVQSEIAPLLPIQTNDGKQGFSPSKQWVPAVGIRLGQLVQAALIPSVHRMTRRYVDAMNVRAEQAKHDVVRLHAGDLISSAPIDRLVGRALVAPGVAEVVPNGSVKPKGPTALRPVTLKWEGSHDPNLWAWVRADRADATVEEVAAKLFGYARDGSGEATSYYAYGIADARPLFGLPARWAAQFPEALAHAPESVKQGVLPDEKSDSIATRLAKLSSTGAADALAMQQANGVPPDKATPGAVIDAVDDVLIQLTALRTTLVPWGLANDIAASMLHVALKREALRKAPPHDVQAYAAVAFGQRERLTGLAGNIASAISAAKQFPSSSGENPIKPILAVYAEAAATSQLSTTCEQLMSSAQDMQRALIVKSLQANQLAAMESVDAMEAGPAMNDFAAPKEGSSPTDIVSSAHATNHAIPPRNNARAARELGGPYNDVQARARHLENTLLQGGEVDPDELQRVQLQQQDIALRARIENLNAQLEVIDEEAGAASKGGAAAIASIFSSRFRGLHDATKLIRGELVQIRRDLILDKKNPKPRSGDADGLAPPALDVSALRDALSRAQGRFATLQQDHELGSFLEKAYKAIQNQRLRTAIVNAAAMIGFSFLGAGIAGMVAEGVSGALVSAEGVAAASELSLGARAGVFAARVATETAVNSGAQMAMTGDFGWKPLVENALLTLGMEGTTAAITRDVGAARALQKQLAEQLAQLEAIEAKAAVRSAQLGKVAHVVGREVLAISGHTIMGMALGAVTGRIVDEIDGKNVHAAGAGSGEVVIQAASVAIGRLVHARVTERRAALNELAKQGKSPNARRLVEHANQLEAAATALIKSPNAERALDVLANQEQLLHEELAVIDELLARNGHGGYDAHELALTRHELTTQLGNASDVPMLSVKLHLTGLRELAPGTLWSGTPDEVSRGIREIQATRPDARVTETDAGVKRVRVGDSVFELHEAFGPHKQETVAVERSQAQNSPEHVESNRPHADRTIDAGRQFEAARNQADASTGELPREVIEVITTNLPGIQFDPANAAGSIEAYLRQRLGGAADLRVIPLGGGKSGASVYLVKNGDQVIQVFKIFNNTTEMVREIAALQRIRDLHLENLEPVEIAHAATLTKDGKVTGAASMTAARGDFVKGTMDAAGSATGTARAELIRKLTSDCKSVARAFAELHAKSASGGAVSNEYKAAEIQKLRQRWDKIASSEQVPDADLDAVSPVIGSLMDQFAIANVAASYAHGDAHAGNFSVEKNGKVSVIDSETLFRSVGETGLATAPSASDVGRFAESLRTFGSESGLTSEEIVQLQTAFLASYKEQYQSYGHGPSSGFDVATKFYQANLDTIVLRAEADALRRLPPSSTEARASAKKLSSALDALKATLGLPSRFNVRSAGDASGNQEVQNDAE